MLKAKRDDILILGHMVCKSNIYSVYIYIIYIRDLGVKIQININNKQYIHNTCKNKSNIIGFDGLGLDFMRLDDDMVVWYHDMIS